MEDRIYFTEVLLLTKSNNLQDFKDWLHWHLDVICFDHIHVFDNESSVDIKSICDTYGDRVSYELIKGWPNQYVLYNRYINNESRAWWVLPIDDDEFLWLDKKYENINDFMLWFNTAHKSWRKLSIGWRNIFPFEYTEHRTSSIQTNGNAWSDEASNIWQFGNRPVKTMLWTGMKYNHTVVNGIARTHNPLSLPHDEPSHTISGEALNTNLQKNPTKESDEIKILHYQFRSNSEWVFKCQNRKSPGGKWDKNRPELYKKLYSYKSKFHKVETC